jgi:RimJ/RimL family protein N-acetyltransferase
MAPERPILLDVPDRFVGERVVARRFADGDAEPLHTAIRESRSHLQPWLPWATGHQSIEETREFIRRGQAGWLLREDFHMAVIARATTASTSSPLPSAATPVEDEGALLGGIGLHPLDWNVPSLEIGYWLRRGAEGHGYMSEATRLLTTYAFEGLGAARIVIRCDARNMRSRRVPERLGYILEGCMRHYQRDTSGERADMLVFAMIPDDYTRARVTWPESPRFAQ